MLLLPKQAQAQVQAHSSFFQPFILVLVLNLALMVSFDGNKFALAISLGSPYSSSSYYGPDERYPEGPDNPAESDYPSDSLIAQNFLAGMGRDQALTSLVSQTYLPSYKIFCRRPNLKCPPAAFTIGFIAKRSDRWWRDFYVRVIDTYIGGASGTVRILVDRPSRIPTCSYFDLMVSRCISNPLVNAIVLVSAFFIIPTVPREDWEPIPYWDDQAIYWIRRRDDDDETANPRDNGPVGGGGGTGSRILGAAASLAPFVATSPLGGALGVLGSTVYNSGILGSLKSMNPQGVPSLFGNGKDQDSGAKTDPSWSDFLPSSPMASLPSNDGNTVGTDQKFSLADATTPLAPQTDGEFSGTESALGSTTGDIFNADDPNSYKATLDGKSLIQRRRWRALLPRDSTECYFPDFDDLFGKAVATSPNPVPPNPATPPVLNPGDNTVEKIFVSEEVATLTIMQHVNPSKLDIRVTTSEAEILNQQGIDAPVGQEITVPVPWKVTTLNSNVVSAPLSWPLYITVKSTDPSAKDSIQIKYGASVVLQFFSPVELGTKFDSGDTDKCSVGDWADSSRQIQCAVYVGH